MMLPVLLAIVDTVPDIPRYHTAIAEWLFALVFILYLPKRITGKKSYIGHAIWFIIILSFQLLSGIMPIEFWIPNMVIAVVLMMLYIYTMSKVSMYTAGYFVVIAFIIAEFAASLEWQISYFLQVNINAFTEVISIATLLIVYTVVFSSAVLLEKRYKDKHFKLDIKRNDLLIMVVMGTAIFGLSNISFINMNTPFSGQYPSEILYIRTLVDFAGMILLYSQREHKMAVYLSRESYAMQVLIDKQYEQYQHSLKNSEIVNQRYHDLKQYIALLRNETNVEKKEAYLDELEKSISNYENQFKTGNHVLDILLTQKATQMNENHINFTCVADGEHLEFISILDMLSLFGNALDNAIESVKRIEQEEKRIIKLAVFTQNQLLFIKLENYYVNSLKYIDGTFLTTKEDKQNHGYGLKSMNSIVDKYNGSIKISTENHWFSLMILLPLDK